MTAPVTERGPTRQPGRGIGRAAAIIGVLTVVSGVIGFVRQLVFAHTVGASCVGTAYTTANQVPNIIYDIVLGGALTSAVVPVLAGPVARAAGSGAGVPAALRAWTGALARRPRPAMSTSPRRRPGGSRRPCSPGRCCCWSRPPR